jgi:hypothetical protein
MRAEEDPSGPRHPLALSFVPALCSDVAMRSATNRHWNTPRPREGLPIPDRALQQSIAALLHGRMWGDGGTTAWLLLGHLGGVSPHGSPALRSAGGGVAPLLGGGAGPVSRAR